MSFKEQFLLFFGWLGDDATLVMNLWSQLNRQRCLQQNFLRPRYLIQLILTAVRETRVTLDVSWVDSFSPKLRI